MEIFLGLGSNLGDREMNLVNARDLLMKKGVMVTGQSEVLETTPLGVLSQPDYLNQVLECETDLMPWALLKTCEEVELEMGRIGKGDGASRIIDIDILFYGGEVVTMPGLSIPHPGILEREFVLAGMREVAPDFTHPLAKKKMKEL